MIVVIAVCCFVFGFAAALISLSEPGKHHVHLRNLESLLHLLLEGQKLVQTSPGGAKFPLFLPSHTSNDFRESQSDLLTKDQVESQFESSTWQYLAYQDFKESILARGSGMKTFPCIYATMGYRSDDHRYVFLKSDNPAEPQNIRLIAPALREYLTISRNLGSNTSLVIVCAPSKEEKSVEQYNRTFWDMLRGLRITDPMPWPQDVPEAVESEKWTFCYNGEPVFPVMLTPAHMRRWSRHMSVPVIALQPKWVLDKLLSTPQTRDSATSKVRKLLKEYDQIDISPDLTSYGHPGTSEARQLCLLDENETSGCPYANFDS